jgi:hypothetical protein
MGTYRKRVEFVEAITFEQLEDYEEHVDRGEHQIPPGDFEYKDHRITVENNDTYMIHTLSGKRLFRRGEMLVFDSSRTILIPYSRDTFEECFIREEADAGPDKDLISRLKADASMFECKATEQSALACKYRQLIVTAKEKMIAVLDRSHPDQLCPGGGMMPSNNPEARFLRHLISTL